MSLEKVHFSSDSIPEFYACRPTELNEELTVMWLVQVALPDPDGLIPQINQALQQEQIVSLEFPTLENRETARIVSVKVLDDPQSFNYMVLNLEMDDFQVDDLLAANGD